MIHGDDRLDVVGDELVNEVVVVVEASRVDFPGAVGQDPRPSQGEPVDINTVHVLDELDVFLELVVGVASDLAVAAVKDVVIVRIAKHVPNTESFSILVPPSLYLKIKTKILGTQFVA